MIEAVMKKLRTTMFISPDVMEALKVYTRMHPQHSTPSQSADHLLKDALLAEIGQERWNIIRTALMEDQPEDITPRPRREGRR